MAAPCNKRWPGYPGTMRAAIHPTRRPLTTQGYFYAPRARPRPCSPQRSLRTSSYILLSLKNTTMDIQRVCRIQRPHRPPKLTPTSTPGSHLICTRASGDILFSRPPPPRHKRRCSPTASSMHRFRFIRTRPKAVFFLSSEPRAAPVVPLLAWAVADQPAKVASMWLRPAQSRAQTERPKA